MCMDFPVSNRRGQSILENIVLLAVLSVALIGGVGLIGSTSRNRLTSVNASVRLEDGKNPTSARPVSGGGSAGQSSAPTRTAAAVETNSFEVIQNSPGR